METNSNHFQNSGREREDRVEMLRQRIGRSDYNLPAEPIASSILSLQVGEMTLEQKELAGESQRRRNAQAIRRIAAERLLRESPDPSPTEAKRVTCPIHHVEYAVINHSLVLDCDLCFEAETARANARLAKRQARRIEDCQGMSEEAGMEQDASQPLDALLGGFEMPKAPFLSTETLGYLVGVLFSGIIIALVYALTH